MSEANLEELVSQNQAAFGQSGAEIIEVSKPYDPMDNETVNKAAEVFGNTLPRIKALAGNLKGGALFRVFKATMEFPLQETNPKFLSKAENELFIMCLATIHAKNTMIQAMAASRSMEEQKRKAETEAANVAPMEIGPEHIVTKAEANAEAQAEEAK